MVNLYSLIVGCVEKIHTLKCTSVWKLLLFFSLTQIVYFFDAGAIAGSIAGISEDLRLSFTEAGKIATFFTIGYILCCPMIGHMETQFSQSTLLACGLFLYILGNSGVAVSFSTITLFISRTISGCGGAFYSSVSLPYVEQIAPPNKKATCLGLFNSSMALGVSLGYVFSGLISTHASWRILFIGEVSCMFVLLVVCFFVPWNPQIFRYHYQLQKEMNTITPDPQDDTDTDAIVIELDDMMKELDDEDDNVISNLSYQINHTNVIDLSDITDPDSVLSANHTTIVTATNNVAYSEKFRSLATNPSYLLITCGNVCLMFVINAFSYWSPSFMNDRTGMSLEYSNITVGLTTFITGIFGTVLGGIIVDYAGKGSHETHITRSMMIISLFLCIKAPLNFIIAFVTNVYIFIPLFAFSELLLFMTFAPVNKLLMNIVSDDEKTTANSLQLFAIKIFGDILSPPVVGFIRQRWDFTVAVIFLSGVILVGALFFISSLIHRIGICSRNHKRNIISDVK